MKKFQKELMAIFKNDIGNIGENITKYMMDTVFFGQSTQASLFAEGAGALDFIYLYKSFFPLKSPYGLKHISVQVKTGKSHGYWGKKKQNWTIKLKEKHLIIWQNSRQPVLVLWLNPNSSGDVFWRFMLKIPEDKLRIKSTHKLNPASRFEIDRLITLFHAQRQQKPPFNVKSFKSRAEAIKTIKPIYQGIRKKNKIDTPFGEVSVTNYAFRHLTRMGRRNSFIIDSLKILPYLEHFLSLTPHTIVTDDGTEYINKKGIVIIERKVLFIYRDMTFNESEFKTLYIRFHEKIEYPIDWKTSGLLGESISHELKFESLYRKTK